MEGKNLSSFLVKSSLLVATIVVAFIIFNEVPHYSLEILLFSALLFSLIKNNLNKDR